MIKYVFRDDRVLAIKKASEADPQKIGEALAEIAGNAGGHLTPSAVVMAARKRDSVLHKHFEWNDKTAAEAYRIDQARDLVSSIHVETADASTGAARAFLSITDKGGKSYRSLAEIMGSADLQLKVLASAERDLLSFESRYRSLNDICDLVRDAREKVAARKTEFESRASAAA